MRRSILPATVLSLILVSAAWAMPVSPTSRPEQVSSTNLVQVGYKDKGNYKKYNKNGNNWNYSKKYNKNYNNKYVGKYHYGNRYWGHRYDYRPYGWQTLGCIAVGPIWYCP